MAFFLHIETSTLNRAARQPDGHSVRRQMLAGERLRPAVGIHVIYELAKTLWSQTSVSGRNVSLTPYYNGVGMADRSGDLNFNQLGLGVTIH